MDNLVIFAGALAAIRSYWVYNLLREEKGLPKANLKMFMGDKSIFLIYILVRPFNRKIKNENLKLKINIISYLIYISFAIGIIYILRM